MQLTFMLLLVSAYFAVLNVRFWCSQKFLKDVFIFYSSRFKMQYTWLPSTLLLTTANTCSYIWCYLHGRAHVNLQTEVNKIKRSLVFRRVCKVHLFLLVLNQDACIQKWQTVSIFLTLLSIFIHFMRFLHGYTFICSTELIQVQYLHTVQ